MAFYIRKLIKEGMFLQILDKLRSNYRFLTIITKMFHVYVLGTILQEHFENLKFIAITTLSV